MSRRMHFWIYALDPVSSKPYLIYGSNRSLDDARRKGLELLPDVNFTIKSFPTSDIGRASQLLKGNRLEHTHSLHKSAERLGHGKSVRRRNLRRQGRYS